VIVVASALPVVATSFLLYHITPVTSVTLLAGYHLLIRVAPLSLIPSHCSVHVVGESSSSEGHRDSKGSATDPSKSTAGASTETGTSTGPSTAVVKAPSSTPPGGRSGGGRKHSPRATSAGTVVVGVGACCLAYIRLDFDAGRYCLAATRVSRTDRTITQFGNG
jgi:hypothetical protein